MRPGGLRHYGEIELIGLTLLSQAEREIAYGHLIDCGSCRTILEELIRA